VHVGLGHSSCVEHRLRATLRFGLRDVGAVPVYYSGHFGAPEFESDEGSVVYYDMLVTARLE